MWEEGFQSMKLRQLYPLADLLGQHQLWSWISFDVANQSFTLIINTLLFPIFFSEVVVQDPSKDDRIWALTYGSSMLLCALLSPIAGAMAAERAWQKRLLLGSGLGCALLTCGFSWIQPGQIALAILLYIPANFLFAIGENFLATFLPSLTSEQKVGRVSGFSWACAYAAALLLLVITAGLMTLLNRMHPEQWRPFFAFAGIWFLVFTVPTALWLHEPSVDASPSSNSWLLRSGFVRLMETLQEVSRYRDLAILFLASLFYATGMSVVIFFASKLAVEYGFSQVGLVLFVAVITVSGIIGTLVTTLYQDRVGHRRSSLWLLGLWVLATSIFAVYAHGYEVHRVNGATTPYPTWPLWGIGNLLGFGLGSLGSANRAFVAYLTPRGKAAEAFGLWGMVFKLAAVMTYPFAWIKDVRGTPAALIFLTLLLVVGWGLTLLISETRGRKAIESSM